MSDDEDDDPKAATAGEGLAQGLLSFILGTLMLGAASGFWDLKDSGYDEGFLDAIAVMGMFLISVAMWTLPSGVGDVLAPRLRHPVPRVRAALRLGVVVEAAVLSAAAIVRGWPPGSAVARLGLVLGGLAAAASGWVAVLWSRSGSDRYSAFGRVRFFGAPKRVHPGESAVVQLETGLPLGDPKAVLELGDESVPAAERADPEEGGCARRYPAAIEADGAGATRFKIVFTVPDDAPSSTDGDPHWVSWWVRVTGSGRDGEPFDETCDVRVSARRR